jgi:plastocyanin
MKKITLQVLILSVSILSAILVLSMVFNLYANSIQIAAIKEVKKGSSGSTSTGKTLTLGAAVAASSSSSNTIQLSVKEESEDVYRWISSSGGTVNPTLMVSPNTVNVIKIQNPTDTKHELIIDTNVHSLSGDINPNSSGQLSFKPTMIGTFTYHCEYHPLTMKGIIQVVNEQ